MILKELNKIVITVKIFILQSIVNNTLYTTYLKLCNSNICISNEIILTTLLSAIIK